MEHFLIQYEHPELGPVFVDQQDGQYTYSETPGQALVWPSRADAEKVLNQRFWPQAHVVSYEPQTVEPATPPTQFRLVTTDGTTFTAVFDGVDAIRDAIIKVEESDWIWARHANSGAEGVIRANTITAIYFGL